MNITDRERNGLRRPVNLADAHVRGLRYPTEAMLFSDLSHVVQLADETPYLELETQALESFLAISGQPSANQAAGLTRFVFYSSSEATDALSRAIALNDSSVALLEPCFDNIHDLLIGRGVTVVPITEDEVLSNDLAQTLSRSKASVLYLVMPNNPTGWILSSDEFRQVCRVCAQNSILLVVDVSFRLFDSRACFDQYAICADENVDHLFIEDTGKIWSTHDLKFGAIVGKTAWTVELHAAHSDLLLGISPFTLALVLEICRNGGPENIKAIRSRIADHRAMTRASFLQHGLPTAYSDTRVSVETIDVSSMGKSEDIAAAAGEMGVSILPATNFYWDHGTAYPKDFIRIALARSTDDLELGLSLIDELFKNYVPNKALAR